MAECNTALKKLVPLYRVISAAIIDTREDVGHVFQTYAHWAARGLKKLDREVLKTGRRKVTLTVNRSTNTATLPPDFNEETFVGVVVDGKKIPLKLRSELVDSKNIEDIPCEDKCEKCNQDKTICEDLTITEETVLVVIMDSTYEQTVIKKLYPDGSYFLETRIPVWDTATDTVIYTTTKQFIAALSLKPCGCIDDTPQNIETIRVCCPDVYNCYYASCDTCCDTSYGGYKIFEETGLIQFDAVGKFTKVYMEYLGFMSKKNGQYMVPEVAFETLVEWVKYKSIQNKRYNVADRTIDRWFENYTRERGNMSKIMGRISLSSIIQAIGLTPKFDIDSYVCEPVTVTTTTQVAAASTDCNVDAAVCPPTSAKSFMPFDIAVVAGLGTGTPTPGGNIYQNDKLIGAIGVNMIVVNNTPETIKGLQFTLDTSTGILRRYQGDGVTANDWASGDVLVVPTFFKLV